MPLLRLGPRNVTVAAPAAGTRNVSVWAFASRCRVAPYDCAFAWTLSCAAPDGNGDETSSSDSGEFFVPSDLDLGGDGHVHLSVAADAGLKEGDAMVNTWNSSADVKCALEVTVTDLWMRTAQGTAYITIRCVVSRQGGHRQRLH